MPDYKLQEHQKDALKQFNKTNSQILFHGLGSGKTLSSIAIADQNPTESKLVLTPAALSHNYSKELRKFNIPSSNYHLVSYETFRRDPDFYLSKYKPKMIIADEIHRAQNQDSLTGDTLRYARTKTDKFLGLSGSVIQNHPSEIASLLHTATGKPVLGTEKEFRTNFIKERKVGPGLIGRLMGRKAGSIEEAKNLDKFKEITSKYVNTFAGDEEYKKHIPQVENQIVRVTMDKPQQKIYDYAFGKAPSWVKYKIKNNLPPNKREAVNLNAFLLGARQASDSSERFGSHSETPKMNAIMHDIESGIKKDKNFKGVVYSNFLESGLHPLAERLKKRKIPFGSFTGEQSNEERNQMVNDYNKNKLKTLLISSAGAEGLDLKGTKYMGLMDPTWNPERTNQIIGRTARFKSHEMLPENERKVIVKQYLSEPRLGLFGKIKKVFKPDTHALGVDEFIYNRAKEKSDLNQQFTNALKG